VARTLKKEEDREYFLLPGEQHMSVLCMFIIITLRRVRQL
jgi:hypothetical protein